MTLMPFDNVIRLPLQEGDDVVDWHRPRARVGFAGDRADMWGQDDVVETEERVALRRQRLLGVDVQRRAGDPPGAQRRCKRWRVDQRPAGGINEVSTRLHQRQLTRADQAAHLRRVTQVE